MASSEKQMIPLEDISLRNEDIPDMRESPSPTDLVHVKFPSRPRRKVVIIAGVIAVIIVVAVAASLIGKYVPEYLSEKNSKSEKGSKDKGTGEPEARPLSSSSSETKPSPGATTRNFQQGQTSTLPRMRSLTSAATTSSMGEAPSIFSTMSETRLASSVADGEEIANLVSNTETKPSPQATTSNFQQGQTSTPPRMRSLTSAATTSSMSEAPSIVSTMSEIRLASTVAGVAVIANLVPNTESKWSRWSAWTDCTKTCGTGTRHRNRTCNAINQRAVFAPISCAGKSQQIKSCAEWSCPDCSKNCTTGTLNAACDACTCSHHLLTGRILTGDDIPLLDANISLAETPYNILAQTNVSGFFTAFGVCAGQQELLVTKAGFVPVTQNATVLTPTTASITLKLEIAVPPFITVHPESKIRMPGQSVTFCCDGQGNPPPEIEWFKDNNIIDKDLFSYNKTLEIIDARGLNGSYRCRAVNMFGAEFSDSAILEVLELNQDSCSPTPSSKNVTLPPGCLLSGTNSSIVDVGECKPVACLRNNTMLNSSCQDPSFCCGPRDFIQVLIDCGDITSFNLSKVAHCSCGSCKEQVIIIQGIVLGGPQEKPVGYGDVIYDGKLATTTDERGIFSLTIPGKLKRVIVTFKDFYKEFEEMNKIFILNEGSRAFHKIRLKRMPNPVAFNASEPLDIPLGSDSNGDSFAELEFPEESFLAEDGSVFQGNAKAMIGVTDSRNLSDVLAAPGDFSTTDEDGEEEILETFGMIKLNFQDESGKQLAMSKPMKVFLDPEKLNLTIKNSTSDVPLKLYWLDEKTGRWREAGNFQLEDGSKRRRKRSPRVFFVGTVTPAIARENLNFDAPARKIAVRVTATKEKINRSQKKKGIENVVVRVVNWRDGSYQGYTEQLTNKNGVACIPIWRDRMCYLQAEYNGRYMKLTKKQLNNLNDFPQKMKVKSNVNDALIPTVTFESKKDGNSGVIINSPLYLHNAELPHCKKPSGRPEYSQFAFDVPSDENEDPVDVFRSGDKQLNPGVCYIKIKITDTDSVMFVAESYKDNEADKNRVTLHLRGSRKLPSSPGSVVCLRFNCPTYHRDYTYVKVAPLTRACKLDLQAFKKTDLFDVQYGQNNKHKLSKNAQAPKPPKTTNPDALKWLWIPTHDSGAFSRSQNKYNTFRAIGTDANNVENLCYNDATNVVNDKGSALEYNCS